LVAHNNQEDLIKARDEKHNPNEIAKLRIENRQFGVESIDSTLQSEEVDLIIAPADSPLAMLSSAAGLCHATPPLFLC
jgi:hypothetical protein